MWEGIAKRAAPAAVLAAGALGASTAEGAVVGAQGLGLSKIFLALGLGATLVGGGVFATFFAGDSDESSERVAALVPAESVEIPPADPEERVEPEAVVDVPAASTVAVVEERVEPPPEPKARPKKPAKKPAKKHIKKAPSSDLARESRLLRDAQQSLDSGDTLEAQERLRIHRSEFPRGALSDLRQVLEISLACVKGNKKYAASLTARFERAQPNSPYLVRARRACSED